MNASTQNFLTALLGRVLLFTAFWFVLSENRWNDFLLIGVTIALATASSWWLWGSRLIRINLWALLKFIPYFLWQSLLGGMDVARRALMPGATVEAGFIDYPSQLHTSAGKVLFVWIVSLLPGSAGILIEGQNIRIHALDLEMVTPEQLQQLEAHVSNMLEN